MGKGKLAFKNRKPNVVKKEKQTKRAESFPLFFLLTGVDEKTYEKMHYKGKNLKPGRDWNGWGWYDVIDKEQFKQEYGFEYGDNTVMTYFSMQGAAKILRLLLQERAITKRAYETVTAEIERKQGRKELPGYTARIAQIEGHKAAEPLIQIQIFGKSICNMQ